MARRGRTPGGPRRRRRGPSPSPPSAPAIVAEDRVDRGPPPAPPPDALEWRVETFLASALASYAGLGLEGPGPAGCLVELARDAAWRWFAARDCLAELGPVVDSALGSAKPNPAAVQAAKAHDQLMRVLSELGLTPAAYRRLGGKADEADELDAFLASN